MQSLLTNLVDNAIIYEENPRYYVKYVTNSFRLEDDRDFSEEITRSKARASEIHRRAFGAQNAAAAVGAAVGYGGAFFVQYHK